MIILDGIQLPAGILWSDEWTASRVAQTVRRTLDGAVVVFYGQLQAGLPITLESESDAGWFTRTQTEWERDTGLTRREQETARRQLRERGLLEERRVGMPAVLWYRVNWARLRDSLERQSRSHWAGRLDE